MRYTALLASSLVLVGCAPRQGDVPAEIPSSLAARREIWQAIVPMAQARRIDPGFVYALVKIESNFDPHARRGEARGLLQIKPRAWKDVSDLPYETDSWEWRSNLLVGIEGLSRMKAELAAKGRFSYPVLWACYHYGYDFVAEHGFDMSRIPRPSDPVSLKIWRGETSPIKPPQWPRQDGS
ncbi:MAG TPA: lytic transglycosylase domain-containing protein [Opitutaceae bacterium]|nr:lytic transglycosylase domain-containing protein [Opitutaceae bacterium]